jgi:catechol 2,3-dioxygenase-like lactoylglutathione lyase family enzyme
LLYASLVFYQANAAEEEFSTATIDMGVVVSNIEKSAQFYTESLGFTEVPGFSVPADFCADAGLTDSKQLVIRVFVLGSDDKATKIKLMQLPGVVSKKSDNSFIHSQLGFSYLTISVKDTNAALRRLEKTNVKPLAKSPVALPAPLPQNVFLTLVRDPDGNIIELVGPKQ